MASHLSPSSQRLMRAGPAGEKEKKRSNGKRKVDGEVWGVYLREARTIGEGHEWLRTSPRSDFSLSLVVRCSGHRMGPGEGGLVSLASAGDDE